MYLVTSLLVQYNKHCGCNIQISNHINSLIPVYLDNHKRIMTCLISLYIICHTLVLMNCNIYKIIISICVFTVHFVLYKLVYNMELDNYHFIGLSISCV